MAKSVFPYTWLAAPMGRVWISVCVVLSIALAGFVVPDGPVSAPASAAAQDASPAGLVRVVENTDPNETVLVGFELDLHEDDWRGAGPGSWAVSELAMASFGDLTGWAVFVFDDEAEPVRQVISMPSHELMYPLATTHEREASMSTWVTWLYAEAPASFNVVVALVGAGGLALAPGDWDAQPTADELLAMPSTVPTPLGLGTGLFVEAHTDFTILGALGGQTTHGTPDVVYGGPSDRPTPLLALDVSTPVAEPGWSYISGGYIGYESKGLWQATIKADETHEFAGVVAQDFAPPLVIIAEAIVLGFPNFAGHGGTTTAPTAQFSVTAANLDYFEAYVMEHVALGAPLAQLIGVSGPAFDAEAYQGVLGGVVSDLLAPQYIVQGNALVTRIGDFESVMVGAVPPQVQDAFGAMDA